MSIIDGVAYSLNHLVKDLSDDGYRVLVAAPDGDLEHTGAVFPMTSFAIPNRPEYVAQPSFVNSDAIIKFTLHFAAPTLFS